MRGKKKLTQKRTPKKRGRPPAGSPDWKLDFLNALADGLHVRDAAAVANVRTSTIYDRRRDDAEFAASWKQAWEIGTEALEAEAARRAFHGTEKPVYQGGKAVGRIREYSDTLLIFLLKGRRPDVYRDRLEHTGPGGGPQKMEHSGYVPVIIVGQGADGILPPSHSVDATKPTANGELLAEVARES